MNNCLACGNDITSPKFCDNACQGQHTKRYMVEQWKLGKVSGIQLPTGVVKKFVKRYLREKYKDKCCLCGWSKINPHTGKVPLVADHIDGNHRNDTEENLRLICWNCDSLGSTFGALNKGNGRTHRYAEGQRKF